MTNPFLDTKPAAPPEPEPVRVSETIPIDAPASLSPAAIKAEKIPSPPHLVVRAELGRGGMGHVHPAMDRTLLRDVALKRLDKAYAGTPFYSDAFIAEAQITGQLEHPNIVPVHELAIDEQGIPYFTMKLVQGKSFDVWLHEHKVGTVERIERGIEILVKVCDAVAYAHHRGVIHRDLKPENVMVGAFGQVYLMDWGLARLTRTSPASGDQALMNRAGPVGTPQFMAPEQARGKVADVDERSDIFGLGALLYEILSGQCPYGKGPANVILKRATDGDVVPIDEACQRFAIAKRIRAIVARATDPDPKKRFQTVTELQDALVAFLKGGLHLPQKHFAPGELIVKEGDKGEEAYMIVTGKCRAFRTTPSGEETLSIMEPGETFGEMALVLFEPRSASVAAVDDVMVLVLDQATLNEGLGLSGWTGALVRALAQRFADLERMVRESGIRRK